METASCGVEGTFVKRRLAVLSTGRQDWGSLRELCCLLGGDEQFELLLLLGGMHCSRRFGLTRELVTAEGFIPDAMLDWIPDDQPLDQPRQAGDAIRMTAEALRRNQADVLVLLGDRFETLSAAFAATLSRVPIVHIHGGEETAGAIDNAIRNAITKLSHLHFTSHTDHSARVVALGEDPTTVFTVGAPGLDNLHRTDLPDREELESCLELKLEPPIVLVTLHPTTLSSDPVAEVSALTKAMDEVDATYIITLPNVDPGNEPVCAALVEAGKKSRRKVFEALGERRYWGLMRIADAMLGNSSSAIIEAPAVGLPAVNVGDRQKGRVRGGNVIDVDAHPDAIARGLREAISPAFRASARTAPSPFGDGGASQKILQILRDWVPPNPPVKRQIPV